MSRRLRLLGLIASTVALASCNEFRRPAFLDESIHEQMGDKDGDTYQACPDSDGEAAPADSGATCDCDDSNREVNPGATELCDDIDNNCDGNPDEDLIMLTEFDFVDDDEDGYGVEPSFDNPLVKSVRCVSSDTVVVHRRGDCYDEKYNMSAKRIHPLAKDVPDDGIDSDCGGTDAEDPCVGQGDGDRTEPCFETIQDALSAISPQPIDFTGRITVWNYPVSSVVNGSTTPDPIEFPTDVSVRLASVALTSGGPTLALFLKGKLIFDQPDTGQQCTLGILEEEACNRHELDGFEITGGYAIEIKGGAPLIRNVWLGQPCSKWIPPTTNGPAILATGGAPSFVNLVVSGFGGYDHGEGVHGEESDMTFINSSITCNDSQSTGGGGIYALNSSLTLIASEVARNRALYGGGIYFDSNEGSETKATIISSSFYQNEAYTDGGSGDGGAISVIGGSHAEITNSHLGENCTVIQSDASENYGNIVGNGKSANIVVSNSILTANDNNGECATLFKEIAPSSSSYEMVLPSVDSASIASSYIGNTSGNTVACTSGSFCPDVESLVASNFIDPGFSAQNLPVLSSQNAHLSFGFRLSESATMNDLINGGASTQLTRCQSEPYWLEEVCFQLSCSSKAEPGCLDPDGTKIDVGIFGGGAASLRDLDFDGYPDYFWPGTYDDVPDGVIKRFYDPDDADEDVP